MIRRKAKPHEIMESIYRATGIDPSNICGPSRHREIVMARVLFVVLCREYTTMSFPEISRYLGRPSHSLVVEAYQRRERPDVREWLDGKMPVAVEYLRGCGGVLWKDDQ